MDNCCCRWGAAVAGEWPEFECIDCPIHKNAFMVADYVCKRHRGFGPGYEQRNKIS